MKLIVGINEVKIDEKDKLNTGEYNIHEVQFEFDEVYEDLIKKAVFSADGHNYLVDISDGSCIMPYEVLNQNKDISIGAYGYDVENDELKLRYSPSPCYLHISEGSYKENYDNYEVPTPDTVEQLEAEINQKQDRLVSGTNIKTINDESILGEGNIEIDGAVYTAGDNIQISDENVISATDTTYTAGAGIRIENNVISSTQSSSEWGNITGTLSNQTDLKNALDNKANISSIPTKTSDLNNDNGFIDNTADNLTNYTKTSDLSSVATSGSYNDLSNKPTIPDVSNFITKDVNDLTYYTLATDTGHSIALSIDSSTFVVTLSLKNSTGTILNTQTIDLPLESVVVGGSYDSTNKKVVLTLQNGNTIEFSVADLVSGLQSEITSNNKLSSDLVDDTNNTNKFVTSGEKITWNAKYDKPSTGIPASDIASGVIPTVPTNISSFTNDSGYVTKDAYLGDIRIDDVEYKNMLDVSSVSSKTKTGITITNNNDGSITLDGTATANTLFTYELPKTFVLESGKTYTLSSNAINKPGNNDANMNLRDDNNNVVISLGANQDSITYTPTSDVTIKYIRFYVVNTTSLSNFIVKPQLELGDTATRYSIHKELAYKNDLNNYTTTSDLTTLLNGKQNTLTAGDNITITNNVISASGGGATLLTGYLSVNNKNNYGRMYVNVTLLQDSQSVIASALLDFINNGTEIPVYPIQIGSYYGIYDSYNYTYYTGSVQYLFKQSNTNYFFEIVLHGTGTASSGSGFESIIGNIPLFVQYNNGTVTVNTATGYISPILMPYKLLGSLNSTSSYVLQTSALTMNNSKEFTPTGNYNPATKKYVDDSVLDVYSADEVKTNKVWMGKPVYRKVISFTTGSSEGDMNVNHNINNVDVITIPYAFTYRATDGETRPIPVVYRNMSGEFTLSIYFADREKLSISYGSYRTNQLCYAILEYTKTTDSAS